MKQMIISTYSYGLQIERYIVARLASLAIEEYRPKVEIEKKDSVTFVSCFFSPEMPKSKQEYYFKDNIIIPIAKAMVDMIQNEFAVEYGNEIIQTNYDIKEIKITGVRQDKMKTQELLNPIINEMLNKKTFCLDGWIRFRLSDYKIYIINMVDTLVSKYFAYKEYEEFISLLKDFVLDQESQVDQVHIIPGFNGKIDIYNQDKEKMTKIYEEEHDDLILGTLITLAPLNIIIHKQDQCNNIRLVNTIKNIYLNKVSLCKGCEYCEKTRLKARIIRSIKDILTQKKL